MLKGCDALLFQSTNDCTDALHPSCCALSSDPAYTLTTNSSGFSALFSLVFARVLGSDFCSFRASLSSSFECGSPLRLAFDVFALERSLHACLESSYHF